MNQNNKAEEKLAILAAIVESSDDAILTKTLEGIITSWNLSAQRIFGYTEDEIIGQHISILIPQDRLDEERIILDTIRKGNKVDHLETIRISKDGMYIPLSITVSPLKDSSGNIIGAIKVARDLSALKKAEEKQAMLAAIVENSDDAILSKTLKGIITSWNKAAQRMFGYSEAEIIGKHISTLIPGDRLKEEESILQSITTGNKVDHLETIRLGKDGRLIPISVTVSPLKDSQGKIIGASKIARDISVQKLAQQASERYTQSLEIINSIGRTISEELEIDQILQKVTDATTELTGAKFGAFFYNTVDALGESYMLFALSGAQREAFEKFGMPRNTAVFKPTFTGEGVVRVDDITKDPRYGKNSPHYGMPEGHLPVVSFLSVPVIAKDGKVIGGLFFGHPEPGVFTKNHEEIVTTIASQAAIGLDNAKLYDEIKTLNTKKDEFIGLAGHELKTPLTSILAYLQVLERTQTEEINKRFVDKTVHQVKKLGRLVSELLDVSKIEAGKLQISKEVFDMNLLLKDAIELIQHPYPNYQINFDPGLNSASVYADRQRIEQVIINFLSNAIKYSPSSKQVNVSLQNHDNKIIVGVKDFGIGIEKDKLNQIFTRFYRVDGLSPQMSGLGIGLYISREIIERHNGEIWVESEPGKGSTFYFSLAQADTEN